MRCHDGRLATLMHDDEDSTEFRLAASHVESCSRCQKRLQELAVDQSLLQEICETLQGVDQTSLNEIGDDQTMLYEQLSDATGFSSSVIISVEGCIDAEPGAECEPLSLDFLSPPSHPEMLGRIGRYEIERVIGSGGMGVVLKGFDTELHRVVAIKVLKPHLAHNGAARRRFAREAQSAAAVVHEHVIPIHDVLTDGDTPYLVMQYVPGQSLQCRVDERGPLDVREIVRIARQVAAGLAAAHVQGVVHRDVKPANILLEENVERVLISDFGLARTVDDATLTRTGVVAGTPHYMSPEQATGLPVDHRSDLFSLGSLIYFMCTGRPPFRAEHALAILNRICHNPHRPVDEVNTDVPAELADLIDRLLSKNPGDRYRDAETVEQRLDAILVQLQNGQRSRRRSWRRLWLRYRSVVQRGLLAVAGIFFCVLLGALWATDKTTEQGRSNGDVHKDAVLPMVVGNTASDDTVSESAAGVDKASDLRTEAAERPLVYLPPDTFDRDLAEARRLLDSIDSWPSASVPIQVPNAMGEDAWGDDLQAVMELLP